MNAVGRRAATVCAKSATSVLRLSPSVRIPAEEKPWQGGPPISTSAARKVEHPDTSATVAWAPMFARYVAMASMS